MRTRCILHLRRGPETGLAAQIIDVGSMALSNMEVPRGVKALVWEDTNDITRIQRRSLDC
jgi:hypothetical protein